MTQAVGTSPTRGSTPETGSTLRVLVVEDDPDDVLLCRAAINSAPDVVCTVDTVPTLREAVSHLSAALVDVALVDLSLPDAQSLEAITTLADRFEDVPLVVLTGLHDQNTAAGALQAGAQDYLVKETADRAVIGRAIRYAIARKHAEQARRARDLAETASHAKTAFVSRMSHELRTPLNAVLGYTELLGMDELTADQRECVDQIHHAGRHLLALINEAIDIARIETGQLTLDINDISIEEIVHESVQLVRPLADERGITLEARGTPLRAHADRQRVAEVLLNLLSNAIKYNYPHGRIDVNWGPGRPGESVINVHDTGPGIAADDLERLFTPFDRLGAEQTGKEGTGIGLTLSRHLTEAMGGSLNVDSTVGVGTTFTLRLTTGDRTQAPGPDISLPHPREGA